jgi:hypothetical protein
MEIAIYCLGGLFVGILSGMFGIGGGVVLVPLLHYAVKQDMYSAVGTSLLIIVPTALVGALTHKSLGSLINNKAVLIIALTAIIGGLLGSYFSHVISENYLRKSFSLLLIVIAVKMFFK